MANYIYSNAHSSHVVPYLGKPESRLQICCRLTGNSPGPTSLCKLGIWVGLACYVDSASQKLLLYWVDRVILIERRQNNLTNGFMSCYCSFSDSISGCVIFILCINIHLFNNHFPNSKLCTDYLQIFLYIFLHWTTTHQCQLNLWHASFDLSHNFSFLVLKFNQQIFHCHEDKSYSGAVLRLL